MAIGRLTSSVRRPKCDKSDCFQNKCGVLCDLLREPIEGHECPFYKTQDQVDMGRLEAHEHLKAIERYDLIEMYELNRGRDW